MGIGGSIFLLALGAILAFGGINANLGFLNLSVIGWVLMLAGVVGLILTTWFWQSRRRTVVTRQVPVEERPVTTASDGVVEEQYREVRRPGRPL